MSSYNTHTTNQIHDLYQDIKEERLILQPDFQRRLVWSVAHKAEFIETILKGFPFPEIYIADRGINLVDVSSKKVVVDGQQRMDTIKSYIDGSLEDDKKINIPRFDELDDDEKKNFLGYQVNVCNIFGADEPTIKEIFRRINLTRYPLNSFEINNAVYDGSFITLAKKLSEDVAWDDYGVFTSRDISRMQDLGLILNLMSLREEGGYFAYDELVEDYIERYNDEYAAEEAAEKSIKGALDLVKKVGIDKKSMWFNKSNFYTMLAELIFNEGHLPEADVIKSKLESFEKLVKENKDKENDYGVYYSYMYTGTNKRAERVGRGKLFQKYVLDIGA
jgi:hypothetical protein